MIIEMIIEMDSIKCGNGSSPGSTFRKSISTSRLPGTPQPLHQRASGDAGDADVRTHKQQELSPRRSINRRHSMEIVETKKQPLRHDGISCKPQLAPRSARTLCRTGSESGSSTGLNPTGAEAGTRRALYLINRDADAYCSWESGGYARITPRKSSADPATPNRLEASGRRSSVSSSSRRSSCEGSQLSVKSGGSVPRLSSPGYSMPRTPLSPASKGVFDFNLDPSRLYLIPAPSIPIPPPTSVLLFDSYYQ